jgi:hypothetical protein
MCAVAAFADVPTQITIQGILTDAVGVPLPPGDKAFEFRIFASETGTGLFEQVWPPFLGVEAQVISTDVSGRWMAQVGAITALSNSVFDSDERWIEIDVEGTTLPRVPLATAPYAFRVGTLDEATGGEITSKVRIGLGHSNSGASASVLGGQNNFASGHYSSVTGGQHNRARGDYSFMGGGGGDFLLDTNSAIGSRSVVVGGSANVASGNHSTVGGGLANEATGNYSTIPGGFSNEAGGDYSFAAGWWARAMHSGSFVWAGHELVDTDPVVSDTTSQFKIKARNGMRLTSDAGPSKNIGVGDYYRDNAIAAWGKVTAGGSLSSEFGIVSISNPATGQYRINVDLTAENAASLVMVVSPEIEDVPTQASNARIAYINQVDANTFEVYITNGLWVAVDNDFTFIVTAR